MESKGMFITLTHLNDYGLGEGLKPGKKLILRKDHDNPYDDEAIAAYDGLSKAGYVANSVCTVYRGTHSAGYVYNLFREETECTVLFTCDDAAIAHLEEFNL